MNTDSVNTIFKAYDIRGKVGSELTPEVSNIVGKAFADWLPEKGAVAVGYDMRPDSFDLAKSLIEGLNDQGREVWDIGEVTSDMVYFATGNNGLAGGVMITASHNPGEYNGIKLCREEAKPVGEESGLFEIRDSTLKNEFIASDKKGITLNKDIIEDWISHVLSFVDTRKLVGINLVVDAGNGMAGKIFPEIEPYVPFDVTEMYFELDGSFPNHIANPLVPENLADIKNVIMDKKADVGVAFDGDGDRAVLIDENGDPLSGTVMCALLSTYFLEKNPGSTILCNAICGRAAIDAIEKNGGKAIRTRVGHSFIKSKMREYDAVLAGEHSGHYYFKDNYMADSGLIAAIIALYILSKSNKKLSELVAPYRNAYKQINETNYVVEDKKKIIEKISKEFASDNQDYLDGLTVNFSYGWFNVRPSNTEPLLRLNAEAKTEEQLKKLVGKVNSIIVNNR